MKHTIQTIKDGKTNVVKKLSQDKICKGTLSEDTIANKDKITGELVSTAW